MTLEEKLIKGETVATTLRTWYREACEIDVVDFLQLQSEPGGYLERDQNIIRLKLELFSRVGFTIDTPILLKEEWSILKRVVPAIGWALFLFPEDDSLALFYDGKPLVGIYVSYRGVYSAEGYVSPTETSAEISVYATNIGSEEKFLYDTWFEYDSMEGMKESNLGRDYLLSEGVFEPSIN